MNYKKNRINRFSKPKSNLKCKELQLIPSKVWYKMSSQGNVPLSFWAMILWLMKITGFGLSKLILHQQWSTQQRLLLS